MLASPRLHLGIFFQIYELDHPQWVNSWVWQTHNFTNWVPTYKCHSIIETTHFPYFHTNHRHLRKIDWTLTSTACPGNSCASGHYKPNGASCCTKAKRNNSPLLSLIWVILIKGFLSFVLCNNLSLKNICKLFFVMLAFDAIFLKFNHCFLIENHKSNLCKNHNNKINVFK